MGCDIHAIIEKLAPFRCTDDRKRPHSDCYWHNAGDPRIGRDYELFSVLAGVRNRMGITPISEPKGLPHDVSDIFRTYSESYGIDGHSHSWLSLDEMRAFPTPPEQEVYDNAVVLRRNKDGSIEMTAVSTNGPHDGPVGRRRVFELWGTDHWDAIIRQMVRVANEFDGDGSRVRLVFFFDN